jgi:hypothetical protein
MKPNPLPTFEFLNTRLQVDPGSPSGLSWKKPNKQAKAIKVGDPAGFLCKDGYWQVKLAYQNKTKCYQAHRIIYVLKTQKNIDDIIIDHIKGKRNIIENLREASYVNNSCNQKTKTTPNRTSIYKGVSFCKSKKGTNKKWRAAVQVDKKRRHLGYYETEKEAAIAYDAAACIYHGKFARLNFL